ncbi:MAG: hypothetical protein GAK31_03732 [Stenotrophomonas maltophilia]|uniref:Potassium-transporting ATPase subunit F n=1 Tax=Stenotrophomonas maltophilia TaxID=40324 RepID=A0A7V8FE47_STEMA|nr:MAG: hypothetical protein GAK31_03732 [Stenotrophomonas maltophilia]
MFGPVLRTSPAPRRAAVVPVPAPAFAGPCHRAFTARRPGGDAHMPARLSLVCGVLVLVAAAYLLYVVLRPDAF